MNRIESKWFVSPIAIAIVIACVGCSAGSMSTFTATPTPSPNASATSATANPSGAASAAAPATGTSDTPVNLARPSRPGRGAVPLTSVSVTLGDATADRVLSFEVTITSIVLTSTSGSTVTLFSGSRRVEATHLAGTFLPINLAAVPQGTYTKADITVTDPDVVFIGADKSIHKQEDKTFTRTVTINFAPQLTVGTTAVVLNLDLNVAASLLIDTTTNSITVNPTVVATTAEANENENEVEAAEPEKGELEHVVGTITAVDAAHNQFTFSVGQTGATLTLNVADTTRFEIGDSHSGGLASLSVGMQVRVEGKTQSDGKLVATEVEATASELGAEVEGIITLVTGNPATQLQIIAHDGSGTGISGGAVGATALLGSPVLVNVTDNTKFVVDARNLAIDMTKFPFDSQHVKAGQRVEADSETEIESGDSSGSGGGGGEESNHYGGSSSSMTTSGSVAANKVKLEQQALVGTVSAFASGTTGSTFVLTVDADSAFALLSGSTTVKVTVLSMTNIKSDVSLPPAAATTKIRVRGLIFFDGTAFQMIALRVTAP